jgi:solute carrier family 13 (sodium-dependent dicarboxylate transporter), member 2/3/5
MNWLQNAVIVVVSFLMARIIIDTDLHHLMIRKLLLKSRASFSSLITAILLISYFLSMFFPNTVVVLSMIPVLKYILVNIKDAASCKRVSTNLSLAMIYGANIGGMGSLTGSGQNLVFLGYIEFIQVPGREHITFFSWLLVGIPATLVLILISRMVLKIGERNFHFDFRWDSNEPDSESSALSSARLKRYSIFFVVNLLLVLIFTALQFIYKPPALWAGMNGIDIIMLFYLGGFLFFSFIFPRGTHTFQKFKKNLLFFLLFALFFPLVYITETLREVRSRLRLRGKRVIRWLDIIFETSFNRVWYLFCKEKLPDLKSRNPLSFISLNRLIYDLPFFGLLFMGIVFGFVFLLLKIGDNPVTDNIDGYVVRFFEGVADSMVPQSGQTLLFIVVLVLIGIFVTEFINNTTVAFIMFPLVLKISTAAGLNPLVFLLAVSTAATGAFMTPIATSVNAIGYAGIEGVSLKRMIFKGFIQNLACGAWLVVCFYLLYRLF